MRDGRSEAFGLWEGLKAEHERYRGAVSYIPMDQLRLQEDLRKYLCLRCAGFLEQVTATILTAHVVANSGGPVQTFASSHLEQAPNLTSARFVRLIGRFGPEHRVAFETFLKGARKDALDDLLDVRNDVAHGKIANSGKLDPARYISLCEDVYDWLVDQFLPT